MNRLKKICPDCFKLNYTVDGIHGGYFSDKPIVCSCCKQEFNSTELILVSGLDFLLIDKEFRKNATYGN
jgi:hypothetical protein